MSLAIDISKIARVRLQDGSLHDVVPGSFSVDGFDFEEGEEMIPSGVKAGSAWSYGAEWRERDQATGQERTCFAPMAAILEYQYRERRRKTPRSLRSRG